MPNMPIELSMIVQDYARPVTRVNWKKGAKHAEAFKNSEEFKDYEQLGHLMRRWETLGRINVLFIIDESTFDATLAYEWANERWSNKLKEAYLVEDGITFDDYPGMISENIEECVKNGNMKWFWSNEPCFDYLDYDFNKKIWYGDF